MHNTSEVRILIVDDTAENMEIIGKTLEKEGYDLYIADSGESALELVKSNGFDLILLDIMMPDMDGFEVLQQLKALPNGMNTPVMFLTGKVEVESIVKGLEMGAVDYIRKPFNIMELKARVHQQIEMALVRRALEARVQYLEKRNETLEKALASNHLVEPMKRPIAIIIR